MIAELTASAGRRMRFRPRRVSYIRGRSQSRYPRLPGRRSEAGSVVPPNRSARLQPRDAVAGDLGTDIRAHGSNNEIFSLGNWEDSLLFELPNGAIASRYASCCHLVVACSI